MVNTFLVDPGNRRKAGKGKCLIRSKKKGEKKDRLRS